MKRLLYLPYSFVLMNWAAVVGLYYFVSGRKGVWASSNCTHRLKQDKPL